MIPSNPRKRLSNPYLPNGQHSDGQESPPKKRYPTSADLVDSSPAEFNPTEQPIPPILPQQHDQLNQSYQTSEPTYEADNPNSLSANEAIALAADLISKAESFDRKNPPQVPYQQNPPCVPSAPRVPPETWTPRPTPTPGPPPFIPDMSCLRKLIPLTRAGQKSMDFREVISEKIRIMQRNNLVVLKCNEPNQQHPETGPTVIEMFNTAKSGTTSPVMAALQVDAAGMSPFFRLILDKVNKKTFLQLAKSQAKCIPLSELAEMRKRNFERARQIESDAIRNIVALHNRARTGRYRHNHTLYVAIADKEDLEPEVPPAPAPEVVPDEREQQFTDLFDSIFDKLSKEPKKLEEPEEPSEPETSQQKRSYRPDGQEEDEERRNRALRGKEYRFQNVRFYPYTTLDDLDDVTLGPNGTKIPMLDYFGIDWWRWPSSYCMLRLMAEVFTRNQMTTHSLWGTTTNNKRLNPKKIDDLVYVISDNKDGATVREMQQAIIAQCYAYREQYLLRQQQKQKEKQQET